MFKKLFEAIRKGAYNMGLITGLKKISDTKKISVNQEQYDSISLWKDLYKGYNKDIHDIKYKTISGNKKRRMATLNMPKVISSEFSQMVFSEKCAINISDETLSENVKNVLDDNHFDKEFQRYLEYMFSMGGMAIKVFGDSEGVKLDYTTAESFIPLSWNNKGVNEGIFVNKFIKESRFYTHLEWHYFEGKEYVVKNELYESKDKSELGIRVSLSSMFDELQEETRIQGLTRPLFVYFKPNSANNVDLDSPLGVSIYANAIDTLESIDIAFDSFKREFQMGKKRIIVPSTALKTVVDGNGNMKRYFDENDEVYEAFNFGDEFNDIKDVSLQLRIQEHIEGINALLELLASQTGFSPHSFCFDATGGVKTATEVVSENSKTFRTKRSHEVVIEECLKELVTTITEVAALYNVFNSPIEYDITVSFDDSIIEDKQADKEYYVSLTQNGLLSKKRAIMKVLKVTEEQADEILQEIKEENKTVTADSVDLFGTE